MALPKKIYPDLLKDSIVEIRFRSAVDQRQIIPGLIYKSFINNGYKYLKLGPTKINPISNQRQISLFPQPTFFNDHISIRLTDLGFVFNCKEGYIGWQAFNHEIGKAIELISNENFIESFTRIGLRYINVIKGGQVFTKVSNRLKISVDGFDISNSNFKTEVTIGDLRSVINIGDDFTVQPSREKVSLLDIDVIHQPLNGYESLALLYTALERCHSREKELFFALLNEDFLATLNPEF